MPQVAAAAAVIFTAAKVAVVAAAAHFAAATTIAKIIMVAKVALTVASVASALNAPKPKVRDPAEQLRFTADPDAPRRYVGGRTAVGGQSVFARQHGPNSKWTSYVIAWSAGGPIGSFESFLYDDGAEAVTFDGTGNAIGKYAGKMYLLDRDGATGQSAVTLPTPAFTGASVPEWTSNHRLRGIAHSWWANAVDQNVYGGHLGTPLRVIGAGIGCYDPRTATTVNSLNGIIIGLQVALGIREGSTPEITFGLGLDLSEIDTAAISAAANVADANGWTCGFEWTSSDDPWDVLRMAFASAGAVPIITGDKLSVFIFTPRTATDTITADDLAGPIRVIGSQDSRDRVNRIIPRFRSEAHKWALQPTDSVEPATYLTADANRLRTRKIDYPQVYQATQARQLGAYDLLNARNGRTFEIPLKASADRFIEGRATTLDLPALGISSLKVLILQIKREPVAGGVTLLVRIENDADHTYALGLTGTAPAAVTIVREDPSAPGAPGVGIWTATGATLSSSGASIPAIVVTGAVDNPNAAEILVRYRLTTGPGAWISHPAQPASATRIELTGLTPGTSYDVEVAHRSTRGATSAYTSLGSKVAGSFTIAIYDAAISDGVLTPPEKRDLVPVIAALIANRTALQAQATALGLTIGTSAARANYETYSVTNFDSYLATLTAPVAWNVFTGNTTVPDPADFRLHLEDAHKYERDLQTAIDTAAKALIDTAISDGVLTPAEKRDVVPAINALINARTDLRTQATALGLTTGTSTARANYETAATNLDAYLATLTSAVAWNNFTGNTTISVPATFRTRIEDARRYETDLQTAIDTAQKALADSALSDGILTPAEKRDLVPAINALINARTDLRARATALGLTTGASTERANYETAATNLDSYLATLTSAVAWNNFTGNTTISSPSTFRTRIEDAQRYETDLQTAIDTLIANDALGDGVLTVAEKRDFIPMVNALIANRTLVRAQADATGHTVALPSAERVAYENAATNLDAYLATLTSPTNWYLTGDKTTISSPSTFRTRIEDAQKTEQQLIAACNDWFALRTQYGGLDGRIFDQLGLPVNVPIGYAGARTSWPMTATDTSITVSGYPEYRTGTDWTVPGGTIAGLTAASDYDVFFHIQGGVDIAIGTASSYLYMKAANEYVYLGRMTTANSGGGSFPAPIAPPAGARGGGSTNYQFQEP